MLGKLNQVRDTLTPKEEMLGKLNQVLDTSLYIILRIYSLQFTMKLIVCSIDDRKRGPWMMAPVWK
jgi:hypothetical protein